MGGGGEGRGREGKGGEGRGREGKGGVLQSPILPRSFAPGCETKWESFIYLLKRQKPCEPSILPNKLRHTYFPLTKSKP